MSENRIDPGFRKDLIILTGVSVVISVFVIWLTYEVTTATEINHVQILALLALAWGKVSLIEQIFNQLSDGTA